MVGESAIAARSLVAALRVYWRNTAIFAAIADFFAVLTAVALPWSTSLVAIFVLCWLGAVAWTMDYRVYLQSLKRPICFLPLVYFALAGVAILWSDATWTETLYGIAPTAKLLLLPALFYHFERSSRGSWVLVAFLASCTVVMAMSWIVAFNPSFTLKSKGAEVCGIFVKNYIDQGQEFVLCAAALVYPIIVVLRERKWLRAAVLGCIALSFIFNMTFVVASRTALFAIPILFMMVVVFALNWRIAVPLSVVAVLLGLAMAQSPRMCITFDTAGDYQRYSDRNDETSTGLRLEFWKKSIQFIREAPVIGHGTGSILGLFERAAVGKTGAAAVIARNPHNQTLSVAIQWGAVGVVVLYAMWLFHLLLFRGDDWIACVGLVIVVQNILGSLFNSHLSDFHEGWMYVLGVGVVGGMQLRRRSEALSGSITRQNSRLQNESSVKGIR
jgi:O-antigen ligase